MASSLGLFIGVLPFSGVRTALIFGLSILFRLNVISIIFGTVLSLVGYETLFFIFFHLPSHIWKALALAGSKQLPWDLVTGLLLAALTYPLLKKFYKWTLASVSHSSAVSGGEYVFCDRSGSRWLFCKCFGLIFLVIFFVIVSVFIVSINTNPFLPSLVLPVYNKFRAIHPVVSRLNEHYLMAQLRAEERRNPTFQLDFKKHRQRWKDTRKDTRSKKNRPDVYAFYVNWDENSAISFQHNIRSIDVLIPEWYHLNPDLTVKSEIQQNIARIAKSSNIKVMPLINNYTGNEWNKAEVHELLRDSGACRRVIKELYYQIKTNGFAGINVDLEGISKGDRTLFYTFMSELYKLFHNGGLQVTLDVSPGDYYLDYARLSENADRFIIMLYDEHGQYSEPGPIASNAWFRCFVDSLDIPERKLIAGLGSYGYDWVEKSDQPADVLTFGNLVEMVNQGNLQIQWDTVSGNPYVRYVDGNKRHIVWFLDGATFYNQLKTALDSGASGVAIWRLGSEDPSIWSILKNWNHMDQVLADLHILESPEPAHYSGNGEILRVLNTPKNGRRDFSLNGDGLIFKETYRVLPKPFEVMRYGKPREKVVALTFDDGPSSEYTPEILNILGRYKIKATFFVVGENAELYPDLVKRIYLEGHEIGNHTFTHPNMADISSFRTKIELNTNQRLIEELTGHSTILLRPPYLIDAEPSKPDEFLPVLRAQKMGYIMVGALIDSQDWQRPSSAQILQRVVDGLSDGSVILLHDAGGDRSQTVKALPEIIKILRRMGYRFVTVSQLLGKKRDEVMPPVQASEIPYLGFDWAVFTGIAGWEHGVAALFQLSICLGIFRFLFLIILSARQHRRRYLKGFNSELQPLVSVVIAAYNEEKVICKTISSVLESDYPRFEVIIVDDGSTDGTAAVVNDAFGHDARVRLVRKENGGKASALNVGFREASGEVVVAIDADTLIASDAISLLVRHFSDECVGAVSGNVRVGNVHNTITLWQHVEYVTGFNLERRAFDAINCITVVPGAIGAWRRDAVAGVGYFRDVTLAEDTDLTLTLLRKGYRIIYEDGARAYTESPADVKSLLVQRYRWSYGTLQCLWKHRGALFDRSQPALGFIALPNMWLFQYVFQSLSPLTDIFFVLGLLGSNPGKTLIFYLAFLGVDYAASLFAFWLERENPRPLLWLFLQRIIYRQLMTYVVLKSLVSALKGTAVGWNKLRRLGNVTG